MHTTPDVGDDGHDGTEPEPVDLFDLPGPSTLRRGLPAVVGVLAAGGLVIVLRRRRAARHLLPSWAGMASRQLKRAGRRL